MARSRSTWSNVIEATPATRLTRITPTGLIDSPSAYRLGRPAPAFPPKAGQGSRPAPFRLRARVIKAGSGGGGLHDADGSGHTAGRRRADAPARVLPGRELPVRRPGLPDGQPAA